MHEFTIQEYYQKAYHITQSLETLFTLSRTNKKTDEKKKQTGWKYLSLGSLLYILKLLEDKRPENNQLKVTPFAN